MVRITFQWALKDGSKSATSEVYLGPAGPTADAMMNAITLVGLDMQKTGAFGNVLPSEVAVPGTK